MINGNEWNKQFIKSNFLPIDAELILKIPLPRVPTNDTLVWHYKKRRFYTVKNGYQVALRLAYTNSPSSSFGSVNWWYPSWFLSISSKVNIYIYIYIGELYVIYSLHSNNLFKRKVMDSPNLPMML